MLHLHMIITLLRKTVEKGKHFSRLLLRTVLTQINVRNIHVHRGYTNHSTTIHTQINIQPVQ